MSEGLTSSVLDRLHTGAAAARPAEPAVSAVPDKLRVALFSGNYNYVMDGPVRALNMLVAHLERRGHEVLVFAPTTKSPAFSHSGTLISISSVPFPGKRSEYRLGLGLRGRALKTLEDFKPDIIHIAAPDITGYAALKYAEKAGITPVASFHTRFDTYPRYYGVRWLEKHLTNYMRNFYGRCAHVYAPSESMARELERDGIGREVRLWTRGVDGILFNPDKRNPEWRRAIGFADEDIVIAFVGRVVLEKGIDVFAEAVCRAAAVYPNVKPLIVGEGPERARFQAKLPQGVFLGFLQGEDLARAYASADVFFNPSVTETFGNVTLEAMASALPSVCAAASGSVSLVEHDRTGFLSAPEAGADGYAEHLKRLARDPWVRDRLGAAARAKAERFSWPVILDELIANYRAALASGGQI